MLARTGDGMKEEELVCAICLNEFTDEEQIETIVRGECMVKYFLLSVNAKVVGQGTNSGPQKIQPELTGAEFFSARLFPVLFAGDINQLIKEKL